MKDEFYILEKSEKLNIGPKEGRVPSYGGHSGRPSGKPAPSLPLKTLGKAAPKGVDPDKHERCVRDVKEQGKDVGSAYAICTSSLKRSQSELYDMIDLMKGGEGSRGGKIIGHTSSGKPIYSPKTLAQYKKENTGGGVLPKTQSHDDYEKKDHEDAAEFHSKNVKGNGAEDKMHMESKMYHMSMANKLGRKNK